MSRADRLEYSISLKETRIFRHPKRPFHDISRSRITIFTSVLIIEMSELPRQRKPLFILLSKTYCKTGCSFSYVLWLFIINRLVVEKDHFWYLLDLSYQGPPYHFQWSNDWFLTHHLIQFFNHIGAEKYIVLFTSILFSSPERSISLFVEF